MSESSPEPRSQRWLRAFQGRWPGEFRPSEFRPWADLAANWRPALRGVIRLTAGAVLAYLLTVVLTNGPVDLTGSLTALLVLQASAYSTLKMGAVRVGAVLSGVFVAIFVSSYLGLSWWSLAAVVAASLIVATILRLGEQTIEAPISAMLILGVSNHDVAAQVRVLNTFIGAGVGVAFNLLYPPALPTRPAGQSVLGVAEAAAAPLDAAARALAEGPLTRDQVAGLLDDVRAVTHRVAQAGDSLAALKDSRRLNARALGTADVEPVLTTGLDTLERSLLAVRALFAVIYTEAPGDGDDAGEDDPYGEELRSAFAVVLSDVGDCLRAFGQLVIAEAEDREADTEEALGTSLEVLRETRAILTELIMVDARDEPRAWLLRGSILTAIEQVLEALDLEDRARVYARLKAEQDSRPLSNLPPVVAGMLPHPELPVLRGMEGPLRKSQEGLRWSASDIGLRWPPDPPEPREPDPAQK